MFVFLRERKITHEQGRRIGGAGRERERVSEWILTRLHAQHRVQLPSWSHDPGIMTWAEIKSLMLNQLSHPDAPQHNFLEETLVLHAGTGVQ